MKKVILIALFTILAGVPCMAQTNTFCPTNQNCIWTGNQTFNGATTLAGVTNTGNETIGGTLGVTGATTLAAATATTVTATSFQSASGNRSTTGVLRQASTDQDCWRNNANNADVCISKNTNDAFVMTAQVVSNSNSVLWVDGVKFTTLAGCYAASSAGQLCHVPPGYSETLGASITISKNNTGFIFEGSATITMGANQIIVSPGVNGATLLGMIELGGNPLGGAGSAGNTGVQFSYTGSGTAFLIGGALASPGTSALRIENISIDLSGATGTSLAMNLANVHGGFVVRHVFFNGNGASSTQTGLQMNQGGNFTGDGIVEDNWFSNLQVGIDALGGGGGAVQEVLFSNNIGLAGAASSIGIKLGTTFGNFIYGSTFSSWTTAISVGAASSGNEIHWTSNTCTTDIAFIAGSTNNEAVFAMNVPPIVTDAGTNNRVIMSGLDGTLNEQGSSGAITGNSADQTFFTYTLPARALPPGRCLDVSVWANKSTGAVNTTYKLFFGSTAYVSNASTGTGQIYMEAHVCNNANSITAQHGSTKSSFPTVTFQAFAPVTSAEATSGTVVIKATFNVANTDQLTPGNFNVRLE